VFITLLHKGNDKELLTNWRLITLLNVAYKIVAKALQRRLQPFLANVINNDQTTFLPIHYILDNVLVIHETISSAREFDQEMILLKLDFMKVYDTINLPFLWGGNACVRGPLRFYLAMQILVHWS